MPVFKVKTQVNQSKRKGIFGAKYHDDHAVKDVLDYVLKDGKTNQELVCGLSVNPYMAKAQFEIIAKTYGKDYGIRLRHMILSFADDELIDVLNVKNIAYQIAQYYAYDYQILFAVHIDGGNFHVHFVMNTVSYRSGMKYSGDKVDYYRFIGFMKDILKSYGLHLIVSSDVSA